MFSHDLELGRQFSGLGSLQTLDIPSQSNSYSEQEVDKYPTHLGNRSESNPSKQCLVRKDMDKVALCTLLCAYCGNLTGAPMADYEQCGYV